MRPRIILAFLIALLVGFAIVASACGGGAEPPVSPVPDLPFQGDIDLAEVYASFGIIEVLSIEGMGLADGGCAARMIGEGEFHRDARLPVNASGGATCGTPISATGLIRVIEATLQLRGTAGGRQVARRPRRAAVSAIGGLFQLMEVGVLAA